MEFFVGVGSYQLDMKSCRSLKEKRQILKRIVDRLGRSNGLGVSEVGKKDSWKNSILVVTCASDSYTAVQTRLAGVRKSIESAGVEILAADEVIFKPEDLED